MESEPNPWSCATNWSVLRGSFVNSLTFESSSSPIDGDDDLNPTAKQPLLLKPSAPDSGPCEITISFKQNHEVQQIYVRSTARVYEIYYESNPQSGKEYLCTVRCDVAARDDEVLRATDNDEAVSTCSKGSHDDQSKENVRSDSNRSSEDEWVEVKVPDNSLPLITQDYYEATAQISDAHPCLSVTLRLLSVQNKDRVYVDEVYVFADPVDSTDSEKEVDQRENSSGNSLMTMLLPTLLQMSKTKGATRMEDKHTSETWKKQNSGESGSEVARSTNIATIVQQEGISSVADHQKIEFQDVNRAGVDASQLQSSPEVSFEESKTDLPPNNHFERALDELSSRMGRIEDLFLRFEANLLKPINSIDARLLRVEQQLEVLTNKRKNSELLSCSRFCAPNFSLVQSDSNSFCHSEIDYPRCEEFESNGKSFHSNVQTKPVNDVSEELKSNAKSFNSDVQTTPVDDRSDTVNATWFLPSLVFTAPEFSNCDDEEEEYHVSENVTDSSVDHVSEIVTDSSVDHVSENVTDSSMDKPRHRLTVEDALASALAGFISSISIQAEEYTPTLSVKAPDFPSEEDSEVDKIASPRGQSQTETGKTVTINGSLSNAYRLSSLDSERTVVISVDYDQSEKTAEEVNGQHQHHEGGEEDEPSGELINKNDDTENGEVSVEVNNGLVHDKIDIQDHFILNQIDEIGSDTKEEEVSSDSVTAVEISKEGSDKNALRDIFEFSHAASVVDFESSVLDVKFVSQNSRDRNCFLEALLSDLPESQSEETCADESYDTPPSNEQCDLISVEDGEPLGPPTTSLHVDFDYCSLPEPLSREDESASNMSSSHETSATSLI